MSDPGPAAPIIRVIAAVVTRDERFLICRRPLHKRHGGLWEFPGGKCEPGESDLATTARELREELAVEVLGIGDPLFAVSDANSPYQIVFIPTTISGDPRCEEHMALAWLPFEEMATLPLSPSDRRFVEFMLAHRA